MAVIDTPAPQSTSTATTADAELKARHRAMWGLGDYPRVADELIPTLGRRVVAAAGITTGQRVLDVAAGSGNAAIPAARAGARVVASDLTPSLLDAGRTHAETEGLQVDWQRADAEALPFADGEFDIVISCVGVMFAPHHQAAADELVRVCRPGGTIALLSWTPTGFIGDMFRAMRPFVPAPPPGVQPAVLWGDQPHLTGLLGDRVEILAAHREDLWVDLFTDGAAFRDYFAAHYGPTVAAYRGLADRPDSAAELDAELIALGERALAAGGHEGRPGMGWEYLLTTAQVRG